jgi:hypothetical protein
MVQSRRWDYRPDFLASSYDPFPPCMGPFSPIHEDWFFVLSGRRGASGPWASVDGAVSICCLFSTAPWGPTSGHGSHHLGLGARSGLVGRHFFGNSGAVIWRASAASDEALILLLSLECARLYTRPCLSWHLCPFRTPCWADWHPIEW